MKEQEIKSMKFTREEACLVALGYLEDRLLMIPDGLSRTQKAVSELKNGNTTTTLEILRELEVKWSGRMGEIFQRRIDFIRRLIQAFT